MVFLSVHTRLKVLGWICFRCRYRNGGRTSRYESTQSVHQHGWFRCRSATGHSQTVPLWLNHEGNRWWRGHLRLPPWEKILHMQRLRGQYFSFYLIYLYAILVLPYLFVVWPISTILFGRMTAFISGNHGLRVWQKRLRGSNYGFTSMRSFSESVRHLRWASIVSFIINLVVCTHF